jgi:hypothetical protein
MNSTGFRGSDPEALRVTSVCRFFTPPWRVIGNRKLGTCNVPSSNLTVSSDGPSRHSTSVIAEVFEPDVRRDDGGTHLLVTVGILITIRANADDLKSAAHG